ncbi:MAG TPA: lysozyme inhibitor LprI family protein [Chthoniobacterales bacterium]
MSLAPSLPAPCWYWRRFAPWGAGPHPVGSNLARFKFKRARAWSRALPGIVLLQALSILGTFAQTPRDALSHILTELRHKTVVPVDTPRNPTSVENDPRYRSLDDRLNEVYATLLSQLAPAERQELIQSERRFIRERNALGGDADRFFARTEQQIASLQGMLDSRLSNPAAAVANSPATG